MTVFRSLGAALEADLTTGTAPLDVRKDLEGILVRAGVLPRSTALLVTGTSGWAYRVAKCWLVTQTAAADGYHLWGNDGNVDLDVSDTGAALTAPAAGLSRIDIIYARHASRGDNSDTTSTPLLAVAKGTAHAVSPADPTLPTGALELGRNLMTSAATSTLSTGNTITQTAPLTGVVGAPVPVRSDAERDTLATALAPTDEYPLEVLHVGTSNPKKGLRETTFDGSTWGPATFTPVLTATTTNPGLGTSPVAVGWVTFQANGRVLYEGRLQFGTSPSAGSGTYEISLPIAAKVSATEQFVQGVVWMQDAAPATSIGAASITTAGDRFQIRPHGASGGVAAGNNVPWVWAAGDQIRWQINYQVA